MTWRVEHDAAGLPRWQGEDSIINPRSDHSKLVAVAVIGLPILFFVLSSAVPDSGGLGAVEKILRGFAVIFAVGLAAPFVLHGFLVRNRWTALIFLGQGEAGGRR